MVQYPTVEFNLFRRTSVTDERTLIQALQDALKEKTFVLHTLANRELIKIMCSFCKEHQLLSFGAMTPPISEIERSTGIKPIRQPGALHLSSENYFERIEAMEFAVKCDDRKDPCGFLEAGVALLDVSRISKTPLDLFLADKDLEAASLPLILQTHIPEQLWEISPKEIVGLTNNLGISNNIREGRIRPYRSDLDTTYSDIEKIRAELDFVNNLYEKLDCVIISVALLSIEETALLILNALNLEDHSYYGAKTTEEAD